MSVIASILRSIFSSILPALALATMGVAPAHAGDLAAFLERAERMSTLSEKVEAEVTIEEADGTRRKVHLVIDPEAGEAILEQPQTGWKSQTPLAWKAGTVVVEAGAAPTPVGADDTLAQSDLRGIDFFPFWKTDYAKALTSDENPHERTVSLYADPGRPYVLYVITFDKARLVPKMIKYYRDSFNNLVRIRTAQDWVMVGSRPRPTDMLIKDFQGNTVRRYRFDWKLAPAAVNPAPAGQAAAAK